MVYTFVPRFEVSIDDNIAGVSAYCSVVMVSRKEGNEGMDNERREEV